MCKVHTISVVALILGLINCINGGSGSGSDSLFISEDKQLIRKGTVKTFRTKYGDIVNCVDVYKQPAFDHPLLKKHVLQWKPSVAQFNHKPSYEGSQLQPEPSSFVSNEVPCPKNTIPIRRTTKKELNLTDLLHIDQNSLIFRFAILKLIHPERENFYGAITYISLSNPRCRIGQNSGASIWIGSDISNRKNVLKAGWMVYPEIYGDSQTRLSIYWTADGFHKTGCYDLQCPGFVQVDRNVIVGSPYPETSIHGKRRVDTHFYIFLDPASHNWWLITAISGRAQPVGYWPKELVPRLRDGGTVLHFGGSTMTQAGQEFPPMGDGHFPDGDPFDSSYFRQIQYVNKSNKFVSPPISAVLLSTDNPSCYGLIYEENGDPDFEQALYMGGPGAQC